MPTLTERLQTNELIRPMVVCRIAIGLAAALRSLLQLPLLRELYDGSIISAPNFVSFPGLSPATIPIVVAVSTASALAFAAGILQRLTGTITLAAFLYQFLADQNLYANNTYLTMLMLFLMTIASPRLSQVSIPNWLTLLPRLQVTIVYLFSAVLKINPAFLSGNTTNEAMRLPSSLQHPAILAVLAASAVALELFIPVALWIPRLRRAAFACGFLLHSTIAVGMGRKYTYAMLVFGTVMLAPFLLFLNEPIHSRPVRFNPLHKLPRVLQILDWLQIHDWQPVPGAPSLPVAQIYEIACRLPLTCLWTPLLKPIAYVINRS